ncbi:exported protein of unknown function (plasmid) [Cupriavidus taiwanensis]|nr:exported protein of unknown function [Cupriavidus taiwanensis]SOZ72173.1 exported protein of unknown function [Cupriavidus taiwanensis]
MTSAALSAGTSSLHAQQVTKKYRFASQATKRNVKKRHAHGAPWRSCTAGMTIDIPMRCQSLRAFSERQSA